MAQDQIHDDHERGEHAVPHGAVTGESCSVSVFVHEAATFVSLALFTAALLNWAAIIGYLR